MRANTFFCRANGKTAKEAFNSAVEKAKYDHGHAGYTGTIAEKHAFTEIKVPDGLDPEGYAEKLVADDDGRIRDKWGPAGCMKLKDGEFLFFGWASS